MVIVKRILLVLAFCLPVCVQAQVEINLIAQLPKIDTATRNTDVWGYVDANTGKEYALVGSFGGFAVVDLQDIENPEYIAFLPGIKGFDIKVWGHYAYSCGGNENGTMKIIDLIDPANPVVVGQMTNTHNLYIDDEGYLFTAFKGARIYDLNNTPIEPELIWEDTTLRGHDVAVFGDTMIFFEGYGGTFIYDASDRANPVLQALITDPLIQYHHSGWLSRDGKYLYITDELAKTPTPDITAWDITDLQNPEKVDEFEDPKSIVHNIYVIGEYAYVSYYMNGFRIFDLTNPAKLTLAAEYATFPDSSNENFNGAFGVYPYTTTGHVLINDMTYGLFIFEVKTPPASEQYADGLAWPNPFQETVRFQFEIPSDYVGEGVVEVLDERGRLVDRIFSGPVVGGFRWFEWTGQNLSGWEVAPGIYFARMRAGDFVSTAKVLKH